MDDEQLQDIHKWFFEYVSEFYCDDEFLNANYKLKDKHSRAVCGEMLYLADSLGLGENQRRIAETIGLLHDIGRFEQFRKYRTYNDPHSVNHSELGVRILKEHDLLCELAAAEAGWIEKAIALHNIKELPATKLDGDEALYCKMIRDADKIDIYRVVTEYYQQYLDDPENFKLEIELPDEPWYSEHVLEKVMNGQLISYENLATWNDCKLIQLSWIYDMNYPATFARVSERGYLEKIIDFLPQNEDINRIREKVLEYVQDKINHN